MAITYINKGTTVAGTGNITPSIPAGTVVDDIMICYIGTKPWNGVNSMPAGWVSLGSFADGTIAAGTGTGSMLSEIFYKIHDGSEANPLITNPSNNVSSAFIISFSKDPATSWEIESIGGQSIVWGAGLQPTDFEAFIGPVNLVSGEVAFLGACITDDTYVIGGSIGIVDPAFATNSFINETTTTAGGDMSLIGAYANINGTVSTGVYIVGSTTQVENGGSTFGCILREIAGGTVTSVDPFGMMGFFGI